jgi:hypothetical protein
MGKIELGEMASPDMIVKWRWSNEPRMMTMSYVFPYLLCGELRNMVACRVSASIVHGNVDTIFFARYVEHVTLPGQLPRSGAAGTTLTQAYIGSGEGASAGRGHVRAATEHD